jgi:hypothetical protein
VYGITGKSRGWKWKNGDLAMRLWFRDFGHTRRFTALHYIEWDMLFLAPLDEVYGGIPAGAIGLSGLTDDDEVLSRWSWQTRPELAEQVRELQEHARREHGFDGVQYACLACGACFPRRFIEEYARIDVPELSNDEVRLPMFGQALGFALEDTGFHSWDDPGAERYFNADNLDIRPRDIRREMAVASGRRVFHPFRGVFRHDGAGRDAWAAWHNLWCALHYAKQRILP